MPGPPPKRSTERRRRNKPADGLELQTLDLAQTTKQEVEIPVADEEWHEVAKLWYNALPRSGQSLFYEPSDWAVAYLLAESLSRDLEDQVVGITDSGEVVKDKIPMKGASLAAYLKGMTNLLVTEVDRRQARVEIERAGLRGGAATSTGKVVDITTARQGLFGRSTG